MKLIMILMIGIGLIHASLIRISNSQELSLEPAYYKPLKKQQELNQEQVLNTKYYESKEGEPSEKYEMEDKLLEGSDECGYGYWVRFSENEIQDTEKYYFLSRLTTNKEHGDLTYYGDRALSVFLYTNVFVFATYDLDENLKSKERLVKLQENVNGNWYFICYSKQNSAIVGFLVKFGGNHIIRFEQYGRHKPSRYYKVIFGGSEFDYLSLAGQFANIYFDFDEPAFINTNEDVLKLIQKHCNMPQVLLKKSTINLIEETKEFSANNKQDSIQMQVFDNEYIITQYQVKGWFRWIDNILVEEQNEFQILNLRSNKDKSDKTGDRALEIHQIYGGGAEGQIYFSTYSIIEEQKRVTKQLKSNQLVWTYGQFSYDIGSLKAFGYVIYPGFAQSLEFNGIQHKQVTKLYLTIGGDEEISSFNGKIGYLKVNVGPKSYNERMTLDDEGALNLYLRNRLISNQEEIKASRYNQIQPVFSQIYDQNVNGQSEYSFGMWSRWIRTYPIYLQNRAEIHSIAHLRREYKQILLEIQLTKTSYLFQSLDDVKQIEYQDLEGQWIYLYFGYNRLEKKALGIVNKLGKELKSVQFINEHEFIINAIEFYVGKHHTPFFNGEFARIQFQFGPYSFKQESELQQIDTEGLPYVIGITQQTIQLIGAIQQSPIDEKYEFTQFQGVTEYSLSGWIKFNGIEKSGEQYHIITLSQRTLDESNDQATLQILRNDINYKFITYTCIIDCDKYLNKESSFGEYWDQWTYIYFGYKDYQTYTYIEYRFMKDSFIMNDVNHYYMSIFSILLGQSRKEYLQFMGSLKQWVLNVGIGAYREGSYESEQQSIKVHFGYIAGTDHLIQAQEMKEHTEVLDCQTQQISLQQSDDLLLDGLYEYGYGLWIQYRHYSSTINLIKPKLMGIARLYLDQMDHLLSVIMNVGSYQFISLQTTQSLNYYAYHESEWIFIYYAYQRQQQELGQTIAFIADYNGIRSIQQNVLHPFIRNHLHLQFGRASKSYPQFNGLITGIRLYLGKGAFIDQDLLKQMIYKINRKPTQIYIDNVITILEDRTDNYNGDNPIHIEGNANQYSIQMWFKITQNSFLYRLTQNENPSDNKFLGDRVFHLFNHLDHVQYSTYTLLNMDQIDLQITQQCKIELYHQNMWAFSYQSYSKLEQKIIIYLKIDDYICQMNKENVIHAINDQMWLYLMKDFNDPNSNTIQISHVILTLGQGSFIDDKFGKLSSFIAGNIQLPKIIQEIEKVTDSQKYTFNEVDSMSEYAVSFWCKFSSTYPERIYRKSDNFQIFRMTSNQQLNEGKIDLGDRLISAYGLKDSISFNTYDINDNAPNEYRIIEIDRLENRWYFLYAGYKRKQQIAKFYVYDGKQEKQNSNQNLLQNPLTDFVQVIFGSEDHVIGFNGQILKIAIMIGSGSFGQSGSFLESKLLDYIIQYEIPEESTLEYQYKQKNGVIELDHEFNEHDFHNVGSYSVCGWFKLNYSPLSKFEQEISCQTLIRLYENEKLNDKLIQGDRTLLIQVCDQQFIKFQTYTLSQIQNVNEHKLIENSIEMDSAVIWHYVYMSYDDIDQTVQILLKQFQSDEVILLNNIWHMETNYLGILLGQDLDKINFDGIQQQWQFLYGYHSIIDLNKPAYQDKLPNYYNIKNNQREMWYQNDEDQKTTVEFHSAVNQYAIGVWTRWESEFFESKQIQFHNIYRFTNRKQYEDKAQLGDRVLFSYLTNKNYEFSTYNKKQSITAINTQIPYDFIEGDWNYIYFAYKETNLYAAVIHKQSQKAEHTILKDIEHFILGYAQLIINKPEFGFQSFKGQIYDLRLFLGDGAYLDDTQKLASMINKLHIRLPDIQLKIEHFEWKGCDTQIDEDASFIQEFQYPEQKTYSISGWIWLYSKNEGDLDSLQGVMKLSTDLNFNTLLVLAKSNQITFGSYSFGKKPQPIWQSCDIQIEQWFFVYLSHQDDFTRFYIKSEQGVQEFTNVSRHVLPKNFKLSLVKFDSFENFDGKLKGVQVRWHKPLEDPEEESTAPVLQHQ
ncbi:unnamed protein product [Paramecium sonneborni]|uniref:Uncharacterized protein n=1 Tax=Paramecium sonneborni TaxID=65129 RepID=A0A8S1RG85_9CILI|nr:unnamed protein product [Paramecium sonneborni]